MAPGGRTFGQAGPKAESPGWPPRTDSRSVCPCGGGCEIVKAWMAAGQGDAGLFPQRQGTTALPGGAPTSLEDPPRLTLVLGLPGKEHHNGRQCNLSEIKHGERGSCGTSARSPPPTSQAHTGVQPDPGGEGRQELGRRRRGRQPPWVLGGWAACGINASCPAGSSSRPRRR